MSRRPPPVAPVHVAGACVVLPVLFFIGMAAAATAPPVEGQLTGTAQADGPGPGEGVPAYAVVPEPATLVLLGAGVVAVVVVRRWK